MGLEKKKVYRVKSKGDVAYTFLPPMKGEKLEKTYTLRSLLKAMSRGTSREALEVSYTQLVCMLEELAQGA